MKTLDSFLKDPNWLRAINKISIPKTVDPIDLQVYWFQSHRYGEDASTFFFKPHRHSFIEAHFILDGKIVYSFDGREISASKGSFLIIPKNLLHTLRSCSDNLFKLSLSFDVSGTGDSGLSQIICDALNTGECYCGKFSKTVLSTIQTVHLHSLEKTLFTPFILRNDIFKLVTDLCSMIVPLKSSTPADFIRSKAVDSRYLCAKQFIQDNITSRISLSDVANNIHLSTKQLNRLFLKYEGKSTFDYIVEKRCEAAKNLLLSDPCPVGEVSEKLGFADEFYFNRYFKKYMGITPLKFRKINGNLLKNKDGTGRKS